VVEASDPAASLAEERVTLGDMSDDSHQNREGSVSKVEVGKRGKEGQMLRTEI
jgi:hypothetical protein